MTKTDQVMLRMAASSGLFDDAIRRALESLKGFERAMHLAYAHSKRHRSRVVTRRKQRNHW